MRLQCEQFATEIDSSQNVRKHSPKMRCRQNKPNYSSNLLNYEQISALKHWLRIYTSTSSAFAVKAKRITEKFTCAQYPSTISWSKHTYNLPSPTGANIHASRFLPESRFNTTAIHTFYCCSMVVAMNVAFSAAIAIDCLYLFFFLLVYFHFVHPLLSSVLPAATLVHNIPSVCIRSLFSAKFLNT